jgi:hypothetical protein
MFLLSLLSGDFKVREWVIRRGVLLAAVLSVASAAHAQQAPPPLKPSVLDDTSVDAEAAALPKPIVLVEPEEPVAPRKRMVVVDLYAPVGINTGGLRLFPALEIGSVATSNVSQSNQNTKFDFGLRLKPSIRFESDWSRHSWTGTASAELLRYLQSPDLSALTGSVSTNFRLDIRRTTYSNFAASYAASETGLGDTSVPASAAEPRRDQNFGLSADIVQDFGGLETSAKAAINRNSFSDVALVGGGKEINADRNYVEPSLTLKASLGSFGARLKPFAELTYSPRFHDQAIDRNGQRRDSQGLAGTVGLSLNDGPIWDGDVAIAYLVRGYADPNIATTSALGLRGKITWSPMPLVKIAGVTGFDLAETATLNLGATSSWNGGINVTYALRENINLLAGVGLTRSDVGTAITTNKTATAGLEWTLNPNMSAAVTYQGTWFDDGTAAASGNYDEQRLTTSVVFRK